MIETHERTKLALVCVALIFVTVIAFEPVRRNGFVNYDDDKYVTDNPHVLKGLTWESVSWAFGTTHTSNWHPITWLSHMADCEFFGSNQLGHHFSSLAIHIVNVVLLFLVLRRMTGSVWASAFVAAIFGVHPLRVESVAWVAERKDVLSGFFWMLSLFLYARYCERESIGRYAAVFLCFCVGLMAKAMLITLPLVLLLLDYWPLGRMRRNKRTLPGLLIEKAPLFLAAIVSAIVTYIVQAKYGSVKVGESWPLWIRVANAFVSYVGYIDVMFIPRGLAVLYPHAGRSLPLFQALLCVVAMVAVCGGVIQMARRYPAIAVGWFWYVVMLVPVIGFIQIGVQSMADRYTYLPSIGIGIMLAWGAAELLPNKAAGKIILSLCGAAIIGALVFCTRAQAAHWRDSIRLCERALSVTENNYVMHNNLANALQANGQPGEAIKHYYQAIAIKDDYADPYNNLGVMLQKLGQVDSAIAAYCKAIALRPGYARAHNNLGIALQSQAKFTEAAGHFRQAVEANPKYAEAHSNLGGVFFAQNKVEDAIKCFRRALEIDAEYAQAYYNLALAMQGQGKLDDAARYYSDAVRIAPGYINAYNNLGTVLALQGKFQQAVTSFRQVLALDPNNASAKKNLWKTRILMEDTK